MIGAIERLEHKLCALAGYSSSGCAMILPAGDCCKMPEFSESVHSASGWGPSALFLAASSRDLQAPSSSPVTKAGCRCRVSPLLFVLLSASSQPSSHHEEAETQARLR